MNSLTSEVVLLGLLLSLFGLAGAVTSCGGRPRRVAVLILFQGVAVVCLAATTGVVGDIVAASVLILGALFSIAGSKSGSEQTVP